MYPAPHAETEVDPLDLYQDRAEYAEGEGEGELERLAQRVAALEQRLLELAHLEGSSSNSGQRRSGNSLKKKQRRKFKDLVRDQQVPLPPRSARFARKYTVLRPR